MLLAPFYQHVFVLIFFYIFSLQKQRAESESSDANVSVSSSSKLDGVDAAGIPITGASVTEGQRAETEPDEPETSGGSGDRRDTEGHGGQQLGGRTTPPSTSPTRPLLLLPGTVESDMEKLSLSRRRSPRSARKELKMDDVDDVIEGRTSETKDEGVKVSSAGVDKSLLVSPVFRLKSAFKIGFYLTLFAMRYFTTIVIKISLQFDLL